MPSFFAIKDDDAWLGLAPNPDGSLYVTDSQDVEMAREEELPIPPTIFEDTPSSALPERGRKVARGSGRRSGRPYANHKLRSKDPNVLLPGMLLVKSFFRFQTEGIS